MLDMAQRLLTSLLIGASVAWGMALAPLSRPRAMLPALADGGTSLYFSPDGGRLITVHENKDEDPDATPLGSAGLWDAATGRCLAVLANSEPYVFSVTFAPDGRFCAGAMADGSVRVWDANTGWLIREASNKWLKIADLDTQVVWAPDNRLLFGLPVAYARHAMHDVETDNHVHTVPLWKCSTTTWRFQEFAVGASPGRVVVARLATGEETAAFDVADYDPSRVPFGDTGARARRSCRACRRQDNRAISAE
jgi:hypothetical protein